MNLIIGDLGNTICKICVVNEKNYKIKKRIYLKTKEIKSTKKLRYFFNNKIINKKNFIKKALFSSVVPSKYRLFRNLLKKKYNISAIEIKEKKINKIIKINIKKPKFVGSDRIANTLGAYKHYKCNAIIVDFGTATTFDVVTRNGVYNGGVIAPGIELSIKSLHNSTALLPLIKLKKIRNVVGKNTIESINSGFYWGYIGLIKNIINKIKVETKKKYKIICTGGFANLFAKRVNANSIVNKDLTIKGILEIYRYNKKNL